MKAGTIVYWNGSVSTLAERSLSRLRCRMTAWTPVLQGAATNRQHCRPIAPIATLHRIARCCHATRQHCAAPQPASLDLARDEARGIDHWIAPALESRYRLGQRAGRSLLLQSLMKAAKFRAAARGMKNPDRAP